MSDFLGTDGGASSHSPMAESALGDNEAAQSISVSVELRLSFFDMSGFEYIGSPCSLTHDDSLPSIERLSTLSG